MDEPITKDIVIFYHKECQDGFSGAWVAWKKFGESADYVPLDNRMMESDKLNLTDKTIYFIDALPRSRDIIEKIVSQNKSVVGIDHHITNEPWMSLFTEHRFELDKSGGVLAWEYFFPEKPVPIALLFIQDIDIWKWSLPETKDLATYFELVEFNFDYWEKMVANMEDKNAREGIIEKSEMLTKYIDMKVKEIAGEAYPVEFEGMKIMAVNSNTLSSKVGNMLATNYPPVAIIWAETKDYIYASLRSNGTVDVSEIAKKYGGGGHRAAAGFRPKIGEPFPWKRIEN